MHEDAVAHGAQVIGTGIERDAVANDGFPFRGETRQALPQFFPHGHPGRNHVGPDENHRDVVVVGRLFQGAFHGEEGQGRIHRKAAEEGELETASTPFTQVVSGVEIKDFPFQETLRPRRRAEQQGQQEA